MYGSLNSVKELGIDFYVFDSDVMSLEWADSFKVSSSFLINLISVWVPLSSDKVGRQVGLCPNFFVPICVLPSLRFQILRKDLLNREGGDKEERRKNARVFITEN